MAESGYDTDVHISRARDHSNQIRSYTVSKDVPEVQKQKSAYACGSAVDRREQKPVSSLYHPLLMSAACQTETAEVPLIQVCA